MKKSHHIVEKVKKKKKANLSDRMSQTSEQRHKKSQTSEKKDKN